MLAGVIRRQFFASVDHATIFENLPQNHYLRQKYQKAPTFFSPQERSEVEMAVNGFNSINLGRSSNLELQFNTAFVLRSDALTFAARVHGMCEVHGYVEAEDREWFAEMIERLHRDHFLRAHMGWPSVVKLLRDGNATPVVMSYSVCDQFPGPHLLEGDHDEAGLVDLWEPCMAVIRKTEGLRLQPGEKWHERWETFPGDEAGVTGFDLEHELWDKRAETEKWRTRE